MAIVTQATKFKVPRENNTVLVWATTPIMELLHANRMTRSSYPAWLNELTHSAREEIAPLLKQYAERITCCCQCASRIDNGDSSNYGSESASGLDGSEDVSQAHWILGGHQPELFHPGVWFKNFYLQWAAQQVRLQGESAFGLHLIVDHDLARSTSLRAMRSEAGKLLTGSHVMPIANAAPAPWEATYFREEDLPAWEAWIDALAEDSRTLQIDPLIATRRAEFIQLLRETPNIAEAFSRFRHRVESANGVKNAELPMSAICRTNAFGDFLRRCLLDPEAFFQVYNSARDKFRLERDITNPAQPVPELHRVTNSSLSNMPGNSLTTSDWLELPFWIYRAGEDPNREVRAGEDLRKANVIKRNKLWVCRLSDKQLLLADAPGESATIKHVFRLDENDWKADWIESVEDSICIRPRALTNTLFLRYVLADLFVHGIGGGIYDAVTDEIASQLWGLQPLAMQVVSASLFLPVDGEAHLNLQESIGLEIDDHEQAMHRMRSAPESFLNLDAPDQVALKGAHDRMLQEQPQRGHRKVWHQQMASLRSDIRRAVSNAADQLQLSSRELLDRERQSRIARSREFSFVLFPEHDIAKRLAELLPSS